MNYVKFNLNVEVLNNDECLVHIIHVDSGDAKCFKYKYRKEFFQGEGSGLLYMIRDYISSAGDWEVADDEPDIRSWDDPRA